MIIIAASLSPWQLRGTGIEGIIALSTNSDYKDGERRLFLHYKELLHYKYAEGFWPDHFIMKTQTGLYFMLRDIDRRKGSTDASLV